MLLLLSSLALAAPLTPYQTTAPLGFELAVRAGTDREWMEVVDCASTNCKAIQISRTQGGVLDLRLTPNIGLWGEGGKLRQDTAAALYSATGWTAGGGLKLDFAPESLLGPHAWAGLGYASTTREEVATEQSTSLRVDAGGALRLGDPLDGASAWVGVMGTPYISENLVTSGDIALALRPVVPLSATVGFLFLSDPLAGALSDRGHLGVGMGSRIGYGWGIDGWVTYSW